MIRFVMVGWLLVDRSAICCFDSDSARDGGYRGGEPGVQRAHPPDGRRGEEKTVSDSSDRSSFHDLDRSEQLDPWSMRTA